MQKTIDNLSTDLAPASFIKAVQVSFRKRWEMVHTALHAAAYAFDPEFSEVGIYELPEVMEGVTTMIERLSANSDAAAAAFEQLDQYRKQ